jgi:hypothetical protein
MLRTSTLRPGSNPFPLLAKKAYHRVVKCTRILHRTRMSGVRDHCEHPPCPSMPFKGIETA